MVYEMQYTGRQVPRTVGANRDFEAAKVDKGNVEKKKNLPLLTSLITKIVETLWTDLVAGRRYDKWLMSLQASSWAFGLILQHLASKSVHDYTVLYMQRRR